MSDRAYAKVQAQQKALIGLSPKNSLLQRTCACGQHTITGGECSTCRSEQSTLLRSQGSFKPPSAPVSVPGNAPAQENGPSFDSAFDRASHFGHDFSQIPIHSPVAGVIQTKLAINKPGDQYEQEADRISEQVMRMPEPQLQLAGACGEACPTGQTGQPDEEHERLQTKRVGSSDFGPTALPPLVHEVLGSPGQPLNPATRAFMEPRFGHDFSRVRVHSGAAAEQSAQEVNARAYTVGHDIVFGAGRFAPETQEGRRLIAHELTHVVQQSGSDGIRVGQSNERPGLPSLHLHTHSIQPQGGLTGLAVQRDVVDDVRKKLSYGLFDWAITDAEAMEALAALGTIPPANLADELKRLGSKYVTRLLDNLPDAAKTGEVYKRVIEALGPAGVVLYATEQLSYGLFDWAITDAEVTRVFNTFVNLPAAAQEQFLADLNAAGRLGRLISNANTGHHALYIRPWIATLTRGALSQRQLEILRTIVAETSDDALETLKLSAEKRFDVSVGPTTIPGRTPVDWDAPHLRQTYLALDKLPEAHVAKNRMLLHFGQFEQAPVESEKYTKTVAGVYNAGAQELAINIKATGDIEGSIIHETGHAVDEEMGWSTGPEPAKPERGGWKTYGANYHDCADDMVDDSGGAIKTLLTPAQRGDVVNEMANAMGKRSVQGLEGSIRNLAWFAGLAAADQRAVLRDRALSALEIGLKEPWWAHKAPDGGEHLADHVYEESYPNDWSRYRHEARSRMLTEYQFRNAKEWFAEAYSFYYQPDPRGKGAKLNDKDPNTKRYFDTDVDTRAPSR